MKETTGFPFELTTMNLSTTGDTVIPIDLAQNVSKLHQFLFNETDYQPTETVQTVSVIRLLKRQVLHLRLQHLISRSTMILLALMEQKGQRKRIRTSRIH